MYRRIVKPAKEQSDRFTRHAAANEARRRRACDGDRGHISRRKEGITVPKHHFSAALLHDATPPDIHAEQEIIPTIRGGSTGLDRVA